MAALALAMLGLFLAVGLGLQGWLQYRRTGYSVLRGLYRRPLSEEWWIGECWLVGFLCVALAAALEVAEVVHPFSQVPGPARLAGAALAIVGFAATQWAVVTMGESWRVDVNDADGTRLVTSGPFRVVRNPVYSSMIVLVTGAALMVPTVLSFASVVSVLAGLELQVRRLEEPYLLRVHGEEWRAYASDIGRFVPRIGRLVRPAGVR